MTTPYVLGAGSLRHVISIERATEVNTKGSVATTWTALTGAPTRASVRIASGRERFIEGREEAKATHVFETRYNLAIRAKDRIVFSGRTFDIISVENLDERGRFMRIRAEEVQ